MPSKSEDFLSDTYRGHSIATLNHGRGWLVYIDHVLQHNKLFVTGRPKRSERRLRTIPAGRSRSYLPVNRPARRSTNERTPSAASSVAISRPCVALNSRMAACGP
jgi:hypothetical protein